MYSPTNNFLHSAWCLEETRALAIWYRCANEWGLPSRAACRLFSLSRSNASGWKQLHIYAFPCLSLCSVKCMISIFTLRVEKQLSNQKLDFKWNVMSEGGKRLLINWNIRYCWKCLLFQWVSRSGRKCIWHRIRAERWRRDARRCLQAILYLPLQ